MTRHLPVLMQVSCSHVAVYHNKIGQMAELACRAGIGSREIVRTVQAKVSQVCTEQAQELEILRRVSPATGLFLLCHNWRCERQQRYMPFERVV